MKAILALWVSCFSSDLLRVMPMFKHKYHIRIKMSLVMWIQCLFYGFNFRSVVLFDGVRER